MRQLAVILVSALFFGCFIFDEIDAGQKEMDRYDGKSKAAKEKATETAKKDEPSAKDRARAWWDKARTFSPRSDDESSDIVSCSIDGAIRFMSQTDCQNSGGKIQKS
jgi:hypothetical protein